MSNSLSILVIQLPQLHMVTVKTILPLSTSQIVTNYFHIFYIYFSSLIRFLTSVEIPKSKYKRVKGLSNVVYDCSLVSGRGNVSGQTDFVQTVNCLYFQVQRNSCNSISNHLCLPDFTKNYQTNDKGNDCQKILVKQIRLLVSYKISVLYMLYDYF